MDWFYESDGKQIGPVSQDRLMDLYTSGQIIDTDLVWNESMADWAPLHTIPEFAGFPLLESTRQPVLTPVKNTPPPIRKSHSPISGNQQGSREKVPTYLWQSITCLILCCIPFGIPAVIYAVTVEPRLRAGDLEGAKAASENARLWCSVSFILGLITNVIFWYMALNN